MLDALALGTSQEGLRALTLVLAIEEEAAAPDAGLLPDHSHPVDESCPLCRAFDAFRSAAPAPDAGLSVGRITTGRVLWPAGANWTSGKREIIIELKPIGPDGNCTGCGAKPARDTGSCRCLPQITAALSRQAEAKA
jgi:hypothetical protein